MEKATTITKSTPGLDHWGDITVISVYFALVLLVGLWSLCKPNHGNVKGYFLAGRNMKWFPVGASLFSSNIGSEHFIGLAGTGAAAGIAMIMYEFSSMILVVALAWLFLPVYISAGVYTLPEYMERRFGGARLRLYLSSLSLILYIFTKIAVSIYAGALFIHLSLGWNTYASIAGLLCITGLYTILGGLAAVIYTDTFQTIVMTVGAIILSVISFNKIGGFYQLEERYMMSIAIRNSSSSIPADCGVPRDDAFHIFRDPVNSDNPWPGLLLQSTIGCMWYWCCDQVIVQRSLAAKNLSHAKGGSILAGYLKLTPLFLMIFPGMVSRVLYPDMVGCVDPDQCEKYCDNRAGCSNVAYPKLVLELMPNGLRGLLMAVIMSAIMSSLTSIFNSSATLFTMDLWTKLRKNASQRELLIVGRLFIVLLCGIAILWIPMVKSAQGGQLFTYIQAIQGYLGTPIGALFIMAILWHRMNEKGAFFGILTGHLCGVVRMAIDFAYPAPACGEIDTRPVILSAVHYTYFGSISLIITTTTIVIVSLFTEAPDKNKIYGLTWWSLRGKKGDNPEEHRNGIRSAKVESMELDELHMTNNRRMENNVDYPDDESEEENEGICRRWVNSMFGLRSQKKGKGSSSDGGVQDMTEEQVKEFLTEEKKWSAVLNINAAIGLMVMSFLIGYFR